MHPAPMGQGVHGRRGGVNSSLAEQGGGALYVVLQPKPLSRTRLRYARYLLRG